MCVRAASSRSGQAQSTPPFDVISISDRKKKKSVVDAQMVLRKPLSNSEAGRALSVVCGIVIVPVLMLVNRIIQEPYMVGQ